MRTWMLVTGSRTQHTFLPDMKVAKRNSPLYEPTRSTFRMFPDLRGGSHLHFNRRHSFPARTCHLVVAHCSRSDGDALPFYGVPAVVAPSLRHVFSLSHRAGGNSEAAAVLRAAVGAPDVRFSSWLKLRSKHIRLDCLPIFTSLLSWTLFVLVLFIQLIASGLISARLGPSPSQIAPSACTHWRMDYAALFPSLLCFQILMYVCPRILGQDAFLALAEACQNIVHMVSSPPGNIHPEHLYVCAFEG